MVTNENKPGYELLISALLSLETKEECDAFLEDICTINEINSISQRLEVARMLRKNMTYIEISESTGASTATISRVNRSLNYGNASIDAVFKKINNMENEK